MHTHTSVNNLMFFFQVVQSLYYLQEGGRVKEEVKEKEGRKDREKTETRGRGGGGRCVHSLRRPSCTQSPQEMVLSVSSVGGPDMSP